MTILADSSNSAQPTVGHPVPAISGTAAAQVAADTLAQLPALAAQISHTELAGIVADALATATATAPKPTAAQRGPEWIAKWGCPDWCVGEHGESEHGDPGWHETPKVEALAPVPFADAEPGDASVVLGARIVQINEDAQAFGVKTQMWVDVDTDTLELDPEQADQLISRLEGFLPKLRALRTQLAEYGAGDIPETPAAVAEWRATPAVPMADRA